MTSGMEKVGGAGVKDPCDSNIDEDERGHGVKDLLECGLGKYEQSHGIDDPHDSEWSGIKDLRDSELGRREWACRSSNYKAPFD